MATIFADTHVLIWLFTEDPRLPAEARETILAEERLTASVVTAWEYADLQHRGRFKGALAFDHVAAGLNLRIEPFPAEAWRVSQELPAIHNDPVDRMLIAHTMMADAILATGDQAMRRYPVRTLW